jgi:hypothetical protein
MKQRSQRRRTNVGQLLMRAFVWVFLAIFLFGSLGVALIATR